MPRKGENIYKRKDGRWEGRYIIKRIPHQKSQYGYVYARSYKEVKEKLISAKNAIMQNENSTDVNVNSNDMKSILKESTVTQISQEWLINKKTQIKASTFNKYQISINTYIIPYIGDIPVRDLKKTTVEKFISDLLSHGKNDSSGLSPKTVGDVVCILKNIVIYAKNHNIPCNPESCSVKIRQIPKSIVVLSIDEQKRLTNYLTDNMNLKNLGILLSLFTGLRIGEICALRWKNIYLSEKKLYVCETLQRIYTVPDSIEIFDDSTNVNNNPKTCISITSPKSSSSIRWIPIPDNVIEMITPFLQEDGFFLTGSTEKYIEPRSYQNYFKRILKKIGITETHYHVLRHTFATRCVDLGFDLKSLSEILGHSSVNITLNRYVHPSMETKRTHMQKLNQLL